MEPKNATMLESSGDDAILIETVKSIVTQRERNESETEDDFFLVSQDQGERYPGENVEETTSHKPETKEILAWIHLCRTCANTCDNLIPIFEGEGVEHDLPSKILKYLPIHISESDTLPLQLCHHCASTLLAWHELSEGCLIAEKKLLKIQETVQNKQQYYPASLDNFEVSTLVPTTTPTIVSNTTNSQPDQQIDMKNEVHGIEEIINNKSNRLCGVRTPFKVSPDTQNAFWKPYRKRCQPRMRNLKKPENAATEDCDQIWVTVMDTVHDQLPTMSEQLENDPLRLTAEMKKDHIPTQNSIRDSNHKNEPHRTIACEKEKVQIEQIPDDESVRSLDNEIEKDLYKTKASHKEESFLCAECGKCFRLKDSYLRHMRIHKDERPFTCHVCGKQFRDSGGLTRHLKDVHAKLKNFTCDLCSKSFASKATREDHRRTHTGERPYVCDSCGKTFKSKASLYIHSKLHTDEFPHPCSYCTKRFRRRQEVLAHITTHTGEKNHACDVCAKKFRVKSELARHKLIHSESKPFVCIKCGLAFRQKRYLNNHIKSRHNESLRAILKNQIINDRTTVHSYSRQRYKILAGKYNNKINSSKTEAFNTINEDPKNISPLTNNTTNDQPIECLTFQINTFPKTHSSDKSISDKQKNKNTKDKGFNPARQTSANCAKEVKNIPREHTAEVNESNTCLEKNVKQSKTGRVASIDDTATMICKVCNKKLPSRKSCWAHVRMHKGEKSYTCHICGKQFIQGGSLYYHLKHVHDGVKNHACDICGRSFAMKTAMEDHRRIHTGERPYVCHTCGKTFKTKASLYIHNKTHTDEFPHKCIYCAKRFRWKQQMLSHLTMHTGEKNHICDICGKGFGVKNDLTRHKRVHSEEKPYTCQQCGISFGQKRYLKNHERLKLGMCGYSQESSRAESD